MNEKQDRKAEGRKARREGVDLVLKADSLTKMNSIQFNKHSVVFDKFNLLP